MGSIQDEWASDAKSILLEVGKTVVVSNGSGLSVTFQCLMTPPMVEQDLSTGGFLNSASFDVKFLRSDSEANPNLIAYGNIILYNSKKFRVVAVNDRPPSAFIICKVASWEGPT